MAVCHIVSAIGKPGEMNAAAHLASSFKNIFIYLLRILYMYTKYFDFFFPQLSTDTPNMSPIQISCP